MVRQYAIGAILLVIALMSQGAFAVDAGEGVERMGEGAVDAVTAPGEIVEGISEDTAEHGVVAGTVTGTAKGSVKAAGEVIKGGAKLGSGAVETGAGVVKKVLEPLTGQ
ncbi:MAG: hypothetical protein AAF387_20465 [Pseudomonadota bacterium]